MRDSAERRLELTRAQVAVAAAYGLLAVALLATRLVGLGESFWHDELATVAEWVRPGLGEIFTGAINHQFMVLLAWCATSLVGESEVVLRLLSALPFIVGAVLVTAWLHVRVGPLTGVLFLFLSTVSPLLLDISRQARGYGLAYLAMGVMVIGALEAHRTGRRRAVIAMLAAGVVGTWTLPQFGFAFVPTGLVIAATNGPLRRWTIIGLTLSIAAILAWYAPHLGRVRDAPQIEDGVQIGFPWVVSAPIDQVLLPALLWIDGTALVAGVVWIPVVLLAVLVMAASPLAHVRVSAMVLCSGVVTTVVVLWIAGAYVIPRYLSFLLVPLFILLASGAASILSGRAARRAVLRSVMCLVVIGVLIVRFASLAPEVVRFPREAHRDAAEVIESYGQAATVVAYMRNPRDLEYYLGRRVVAVGSSEVVRAVCEAKLDVLYVNQPFALSDVVLPCVRSVGVRHYRFRQYARGGEMNVWLIPPG